MDSDKRSVPNKCCFAILTSLQAVLRKRGRSTERAYLVVPEISGRTNGTSALSCIP